jgi:hypothetical protein
MKSYLSQYVLYLITARENRPAINFGEYGPLRSRRLLMVGAVQRTLRPRNLRPGAACRPVCRPVCRWPPPRRGFSRAAACLMTDTTFIDWKGPVAQELLSVEYSA